MLGKFVASPAVRQVARRPKREAALRNAIRYVILSRSKEQVGWVHARWIVAPMANHLSARHWPFRHLEADPVSTARFAIDPKVPIALA